MELYLILFIAGIGAFALLTIISIIYGDNVSIKEDKRVAQVKNRRRKKLSYQKLKRNKNWYKV